MESKTVFDGNKFTVNFGKADAEQLEEGFLTSTLWSALTVNVELTDLVFPTPYWGISFKQHPPKPAPLLAQNPFLRRSLHLEFRC